MASMEQRFGFRVRAVPDCKGQPGWHPRQDSVEKIPRAERRIDKALKFLAAFFFGFGDLHLAVNRQVEQEAGLARFFRAFLDELDHARETWISEIARRLHRLAPHRFTE